MLPRLDQDVVKYLFYRVCFGMRDSFEASQAPAASIGYHVWYQPPTEAATAAAAELPVGSGSAERSYYLYVAITPPVVIKGDSRGEYAEHLRSLQLELLTGEERWIQRRQSPVCFGDALDSQLSRDLSEVRNGSCLRTPLTRALR